MKRILLTAILATLNTQAYAVTECMNVLSGDKVQITLKKDQKLSAHLIKDGKTVEVYAGENQLESEGFFGEYKVYNEQGIAKTFSFKQKWQPCHPRGRQVCEPFPKTVLSIDNDYYSSCL